MRLVRKAFLRFFGLFLVLLGTFLIAVSVLQEMPVATPGQTSQASGGMVLLIGPVPIALGFGPYGLQMVVLALSSALLLVVLAFVAFVVFFGRASHHEG